MKPRLFIGSSVESISIAYALQENLKHNAEVTVWSQGVFHLSLTAVESLIEILKTSDFAAFVFSPNDLVTIRGEQTNAVRDNVLFELGLFVGALGRNRCFILQPDKSDDIRIPTDLFGMTAARFETGRSDENWPAATGPACHAMRETIARLGRRPDRPDFTNKASAPNVLAEVEPKPVLGSASSKSEPSDQSPQEPWDEAFLDGQIARAETILNARIEEATVEDERIDLQAWLGIVKGRENIREGAAFIQQLIDRHPDQAQPYIRLALLNYWHDRFNEALRLFDLGIQNTGKSVELVRGRVKCLIKLGLPAEAEALLPELGKPDEDLMTIYVEIAEYYHEKGEIAKAIELLGDGNERLPGNENILKHYADALADSLDCKQALLRYDELVTLRPQNVDYLIRRANIFLALELNDLAMRDYRRAKELAKVDDVTILANIGNLLKNRGFYRDGIDCLRKALEADPESQYSHERLAQAMKLRDEEDKKAEALLSEARRQYLTIRLRKLENSG